MKKKGKIIILSGPSGSGKTTLYEKLLKNVTLKKKLKKIVSYTTRSKRIGEKNGRDYFFVSLKMFLYKKRTGHFLETEKVFSNFYGTPKKGVAEVLGQGQNILLCIDVKGARQVLKMIPEAVSIFVNTSDYGVLRSRLIARGSENKKVLSLRLKTAKEELKAIGQYDHVVINDRLVLAVQKLEKLVFSVIQE